MAADRAIPPALGAVRLPPDARALGARIDIGLAGGGVDAALAARMRGGRQGAADAAQGHGGAGAPHSRARLTPHRLGLSRPP